MSNHVNRKTRMDPAKKRREYLLEKARADALTGLGAIATFGCVGISVLVFFALFLALAFSPSFAVVPILADCGFALMVLAGSVWLALTFWRSSAEAAKSIPYVPPVHEQLAALPAGEVLLRGSEEPAAAPTELLRAAQAGMDNPVDELLRPGEATPEVEQQQWVRRSEQ